MVLHKPPFTGFHNFACTSNYFIYLSLLLFIISCSVVLLLTMFFSLQYEGQFITCLQLLTGCWVNVLTAVFGYIIANCCMLYIKYTASPESMLYWVTWWSLTGRFPRLYSSTDLMCPWHAPWAYFCNV